MKFFRIMPCRKDALESTLEGYKLTEVHLVAYDDPCSGPGQIFSPAGIGEDIGSYYFIPRLAQFTGIELEIIIQLIYSGFVFLSLISASIAIWLYFRSLLAKVIGVMALSALSLIIAAIGDYYIFAGSIPMAIVPWLIYMIKKPPKNIKYLYLFFFLIGIILSMGHLIRSHSSTGVIIFILISFVFIDKPYSIKQKFISILFLSLSMCLIFNWFDSIVDQRNEYLSSVETNFDLSGDRVMWHNIYYSLGYLKNNYGQVDGYESHEASDSYSVKRAFEIDPNVKLLSREYEDILRKETFSFIKSHKLFFLKSIIAKTGVMLTYILAFMNIGVLIFLYYKTSLEFNLPFLSGIVFNMLFGVITTPEYLYLTGLFLFSVLYSIYIIDSAIFNKFEKKYNKSRSFK